MIHYPININQSQSFGNFITSRAVDVQAVQVEVQAKQLVQTPHDSSTLADFLSPALISNISAVLSNSFASNE